MRQRYNDSCATMLERIQQYTGRIISSYYDLDRREHTSKSYSAIYKLYTPYSDLAIDLV